MGTINFFRSANKTTMSNKKNPATAKKPAALLWNKLPSHHPNPNPAKNKKKKAKKNAVMPITMPAVAVEAPLTAFAFVICT